MNDKDIIDRFNNTMIEIANQVKKNAEIIDNVQLIMFLELILQKKKEESMVFVYGE